MVAWVTPFAQKINQQAFDSLFGHANFLLLRWTRGVLVANFQHHKLASTCSRCHRPIYSTSRTTLSHSADLNFPALLAVTKLTGIDHQYYTAAKAPMAQNGVVTVASQSWLRPRHFPTAVGICFVARCVAKNTLSLLLELTLYFVDIYWHGVH